MEKEFLSSIWIKRFLEHNFGGLYKVCQSQGLSLMMDILDFLRDLVIESPRTTTVPEIEKCRMPPCASPMHVSKPQDPG